MMMLQHGSSIISNDFPSKQWHDANRETTARGLRILMEGHVSGMGPAASASNLVAVRVPWRRLFPELWEVYKPEKSLL
jgi:hypothetical protein